MAELTIDAAAIVTPTGQRFTIPAPTTAYGSGAAYEVSNLGVALMRPRARGRIALVSADPMVPPTIEHHYDSEPADIAIAIEIPNSRLAANMSDEERARNALAATKALVEQVRSARSAAAGSPLAIAL